MKIARIWLLCLVLVSFASAGWSQEGGKYYTRTNIWYEHPEKIYSTNYHKGTILPVGTAVKIIDSGRRKIRFTTDSGTAFTIVHVTKHNPITLQALQDRIFSKDDPMARGGKFNKFTKKEQENIKAGTIALGMRKDAVIMAYGYPPDHKTPSLEGNTWTYWESRFRRVVVRFGSDNKVVEIVH
jgi:hypothetical protein